MKRKGNIVNKRGPEISRIYESMEAWKGNNLTKSTMILVSVRHDDDDDSYKVCVRYSWTNNYDDDDDDNDNDDDNVNDDACVDV